MQAYTSVVVGVRSGSGSSADSLSDSHGTMLNSSRNVLHSDSYLLANTDNSKHKLVVSRPANSATLSRLLSGIPPSLIKFLKPLWIKAGCVQNGCSIDGKAPFQAARNLVIN